MISERLVLEFVASTPRHRVTLKQLLRELNVRGGERQALRGLLTQLVARRLLIERRHVFELAPAPSSRPSAKPPAPKRVPASDLQGRISLHRDGFGFVSPDVPVPGISGDIFIPPPATGGAMQGDRVAVELVRRKSGPGAETRAEGRVVAILHRAQATLVGIFHESPRGNYVQPFDDRVRERILIPPDAERPLPSGSVHRVLGAKTAPAASETSLEGMAVEVNLTHFAREGSAARGRVTEILGRRDDFGVDVEIIIRKHHLAHRFPDSALKQAATYSATISPDTLARRRDFRDLPVVTIDGESARDFDDAVLVRRRDNGNFELQVHIADVAHYVAPGSPIDLEARNRGTSVYFPDRAVPMLPKELSTDLCSLRPGMDRLVLSCLMEIDPAGEVVGHDLVPGVIHSAARMTYTQVNAVLLGDAAARHDFAPLVSGFECMAELQSILYSRRQRRGSIDFDLPEPEIEFDEQGMMRSIVKSERNLAHRLIEEFMLAAAETVARHLRAAGLPSVYRVHEQPDLKKVAEFEELAATFGYSLGTGPLPIQRVRLRGKVVEVPQSGKFKISPRNYQKLAAQVAGKPEERMLSFLMLRSLKQARYSSQNLGHFALATDCYTHFTSPIRRYPDLMVHRILKAHLAGEKPPPDLSSETAMEALCRTASERERGADEAERELMDWKKVRFMESRLGDVFSALIIHVTRQGFYLELEDMFIEGFVPASSLDDDVYLFREASHEWYGERSKRRFRLGGRLQVQLDRIDPVRQQIHFAPVRPA